MSIDALILREPGPAHNPVIPNPGASPGTAIHQARRVSSAANTRAPIWVVDPLVPQVGDNQPLRDTDVNRVGSVEGMAWATPLYVGDAQARLLTGGATKPRPLEFVRIELYVIPKRNSTGSSAERVDTRVLQVIYKFANDSSRRIYVGQQMDLFIEE